MKKKNIIIISILSIIIIAGAAYFTTQKIQKENRKYEIETISEYKYFVLKENEKYGVIDTKGNKIIEAKYKITQIKKVTKKYSTNVKYPKTNSRYRDCRK